jgi:hypothetical protein
VQSLSLGQALRDADARSRIAPHFPPYYWCFLELFYSHTAPRWRRFGDLAFTRRTLGRVVGGQPFRGFESHPLRSNPLLHRGLLVICRSALPFALLLHSRLPTRPL